MITPRLHVPVPVRAAWSSRLLTPLVAIALLAGASLVALDRPNQAVAFDNTYTVEAGDTLSGIAVNAGIADADIDDWVEQVVVLNNLPDADTIIEGQTLDLPIGSATDAAATANADTSTNTDNTDASLTPIKEPQTYTIQEGDTLLGIAIALDVPDEMAWVDEVVDLNGLDSPDMLTVGEVLQLPSDTPAASSDNSTASTDDSTSTASADESTSTASSDDSTSTASTDATPEAEPTYTPVDPADYPSTYTVQNDNENLFDLAASYGIPAGETDAWVQATVALNNLDANGLYPGDVIQLPGPGQY